MAIKLSVDSYFHVDDGEIERVLAEKDIKVDVVRDLFPECSNDCSLRFNLGIEFRNDYVEDENILGLAVFDYLKSVFPTEEMIYIDVCW